MGTPHLERGGGSNASPTKGERGASPYLKGEERSLPLPRGGEEEGTKEGGSQAGSSKESTRRSHTSRELSMLDPSEIPPPKRARRSTRGAETIDNSCEATRESSMICPIKCGCRNSFLDIREKTRVVSHILRATRKILNNELIASFGFTAAITNKDKISELKQAQKERNSDLYRTSIQYTVLGSIHGKEVCLVPPQDVSLLLKDRISTNLRKHLKLHNETEGLGQLAKHTCCDIHWNANLEVAAIEHYEAAPLCCAISPIRGPLASIMMSSTASALSNLITKPSALAAVPFDLGMPRIPERAYLALARAMVIQALDTVLASPVSH